MAKLTSDTSSAFIILRVYSRESDDEDWAMICLEMHGNGVNFKTTGAFLTFEDVRHLICGVQSVLVGQNREYVLDPIEPYFSFHVCRSANDEERFHVGISYRESATDIASKGASFLTGSAALITFCSSLNEELQRCVYNGPRGTASA